MERIALATLLLALLAVWRPSEAAAQAADGPVQASLVVCGPGRDIYELEGHAALRVHGGGLQDVAVNWGLFDFDAPGFVWRFALGETDYMCGAMPWAYFKDSYGRQGRRVTEYPLLLDSAETARLVGLLEANLRPENATYRYNYVRDNCSTRPLRMVERAIADSLRLPQPAGHPGETYREMMRAYHRSYPWYQFGIDLALGGGIDRPIDAHAKSFSPVALGAQLPGARRQDGRPIAGEPRVVVEGAGDATEGPTPWWVTPMAVAVAVLAASVAMSVRDCRRGRVCRAFDTVLYGAFGLTGCLLLFLVVISTHEATSPNWLLVWLNPLCLVPVVFLWTKRAKRLVMWYQIANFAAITALCAAWPLLGQSANLAFWPLMAADAVRAASYIIITRKTLRRR